MGKDNNDKFVPSIFVFGIIAIVAIVSLVLFKGGGIVGAPIAPVGKEQIEEFQKLCVDDDPLNEKDIPGTATYGTIIYEDHCRDDTLYQYFCASSTIVEMTRPFECENGCLNGVCLS